jgi:hypothetical protein
MWRVLMRSVVSDGVVNDTVGGVAVGDGNVVAGGSRDGVL